jgi:ABC-type transport system involved in multi-copper enzyme maturation permease subunit
MISTALLRSEWTKFRTVRGWVTGLLVGALLIVFVAVLAGASATSHHRGAVSGVPLGPGGEAVTDSFYFVHQSLPGNGVLTASVASLRDTTPGVQDPGLGAVPWAKAGLIIKESTRQGSPYAAIMVTAGHGVRMQYNYVNDMAGLPGKVSAAAPRWLRLVRLGDTITGYDSVDGAHWIRTGTVRLGGLGATAQAGLFVASPPYVQGGGSAPSVATAVFGDLSLRDQSPGSGWSGEQLGPDSPSFSGYPPPASGAFTQSAGSVTVTGAGDIAPAVREALVGAGTIGDLLTGVIAALIAVIVVGTLFITAEYRKGLIRTTLAASPRRGRVLIAKAVVAGLATFAAGLAGAVVAVPLGVGLAHAKGLYVYPVTSMTQLRIEVGTAVMLAVVAVLALAIGTVLRRSGGAVTAVTLSFVLPYLLVATPIMPASAANWLTRVTPAAAFSVEQSLVPYPQVNSIYTPANGYYPLAPWSGIAVLCGYAVVALAVAAVLLRRRDA